VIDDIFNHLSNNVHPDLRIGFYRLENEGSEKLGYSEGLMTGETREIFYNTTPEWWERFVKQDLKKKLRKFKKNKW
jgi:hypothetical protein